MSKLSLKRETIKGLRVQTRVQTGILGPTLQPPCHSQICPTETCPRTLAHCPTQLIC